MIRQGLFLLCMLIASLTTASVTHAQEFAGNAVIECSGYVHSAGDADQSDGDADKAAPHHHRACHGSGVFLAGGAHGFASAYRLAAAVVPQAEAELTGKSIGPALRPPSI
ncbi:hypothetical protein [Novosphingobium sp. SG707]|uniref:hypothetical protein n=1 Tax=Novosphingobium sp. SG707 TaxID=2586996 RepID=UPI0014456E25|nr:hypothetical protein [Novosphingobium sp. SG707]NKI98586.1 hypothetical protein [Novosphingobium sp. SG707]